MRAVKILLAEYQRPAQGRENKMTFKEHLKKDIDRTFINIDEFSDYHTVNGKQMKVQVDSNELIDRQKRYQYNLNLYSDGIYLEQLLFYVKASDMEAVGGLPKIGRSLNFDGREYIVADAIDENGIYSIELNGNRSARR